MYKLIIKQKEVDGRKELSDDEILGVLTKMVKQRKDSISQFAAAGRQDLVDVESAEIQILQAFLPQPLSEAEIGRNGIALNDSPEEVAFAQRTVGKGATLWPCWAKRRGR